jgi:prevent-host-death family protein
VFRWLDHSLLCYDYNDYYSHAGDIMSAGTWSVAEAKAKFSQLVDEAQTRGPQTITRNGRVTAVVVAAEEWERKAKRRGNLAEFLLASPLRGSGAKIGASPIRLRKNLL